LFRPGQTIALYTNTNSVEYNTHQSTPDRQGEKKGVKNENQSLKQAMEAHRVVVKHQGSTLSRQSAHRWW
jgi:hypothetical protein